MIEWSLCLWLSSSSKRPQTSLNTNSLTISPCHRLCVWLTDDVGQNEDPANDESPDLPHCHVAVHIGWASSGDAGTELSVTQARQDGRDGRYQKAQHNGRPCLLSGHLSTEHVDPRAQGGAHPQRDEVQGGQAAGKLGVHLPGVQGDPTQQHLGPAHQSAVRHDWETGGRTGALLHLWNKGNLCSVNRMLMAETSQRTHNMGININMYVCMCVCVCRMWMVITSSDYSQFAFLRNGQDYPPVW